MYPQRTTPDGQPLYRCSRCAEWKLAVAYSKCTTRPRGLSPRCKECDRVARAATYAAHKDTDRARNTRWRQANREHKNAKARERYALDPEPIKARNRAWHQAHKDVAKAYEAAHPHRWRNPDYLADYGLANKDRLAAAKKAYAQTERGREVLATCSTNRRAREAQTQSDLTGAQWRLVLRLQDGCCARCRRPFGADLVPCRDHIIPISAGGDLTLSNVQGLCASCNAMKGTKRTDYRSPAMRVAIAQYLGASMEGEDTA